MNHKETKEYSELTARETAWIDSYLERESKEYLNIEEATIKAFEISPENALSYGRSVLARPRIKRLVEDHLQTDELPTLEQFKSKLWRAINDPKGDPRAMLGALTLYADISGWRVKSAVKNATKDDTPNPLEDLIYETNSKNTESNSNGIVRATEPALSN